MVPQLRKQLNVAQPGKLRVCHLRGVRAGAVGGGNRAGVRSVNPAEEGCYAPSRLNDGGEGEKTIGWGWGHLVEVYRINNFRVSS